MGVVGGAVERVNYPAIFSVAVVTMNRQSPRLFGKNGVARKVRMNTFNDQLFGREVGLGNQVDITFVRDLNSAAELFRHNTARIARRLNRKIKQGAPFID